MLRRTLPIATLLACVTLIAGACASRAPRVIRVAPDGPPIAAQSAAGDPRVEGLAARLANDCLSRAWLRDFRSQHGRVPVVRVMPLRVYGDLTINANTLTSRLEARLSGSGQVAVAGIGVSTGAQASAAVSPDVAAELRDQAKHASDETVKTAQPAAEQPAPAPQRADFVLVGSVNGGRVSLSLIHVTRNTKVWIGLAQI
ncbi:MAG: hypothetical protein KC503_40215 [Myxococcales bacterium]|nr:hypothetical protein [Myxococcales bacterium]